MVNRRRFLQFGFHLWVDLWVGIMARQAAKLSALKVSSIKEVGTHSIGENLYLQVTTSGSRSWLFRFMLNGKARVMGLGSCNTISLATARELAGDARKLVSLNIDPIESKRIERSKEELELAKTKTFSQCAESYIEANKAGWRNAKHVSQWTNTLTTYAYPVFGNIAVQDIDTDLVIKVLLPIWNTKTETATRVRGRIENILDWAKVMGLRKGENPALWRGHLQKLLPIPSKVHKVKHHDALPYMYVAEFMAGVSTLDCMSARALELTILTAARTSEVIEARWQEFDLKEKVWVVPANRIKMGKEHRVPLSLAALAILKPLYEQRNNDFLFPGMNPEKTMSNMAMLELLKGMKKENWPHFTVHGFRSTFRDWAEEQTNFSRSVIEMSLSHAIGDKVEAAYRRGDLFEKRKLLMDLWAQYCYAPKTEGKVVTGKFGGL